jgi:beta-lactamase regulating signal transducer with metallopeptidase domain
MISTINEMALALGNRVELSILGKATILLALGLILAGSARRARASLRHLLLASTFAALLALPFVALSATGLTVEIPVARPIVSPLTSMEVSSLAPAVHSHAAIVSDPGRPAEEAGAWSAPAWSTLTRAGWALGALCLLISLGVDLWRLRRLRRAGLPWPARRELVQALAADRGARQTVEVLLHEEIPAPLTCGLLRPVILLPADATEWKETDLRRALVHELEHIRRGDWALQLATRAVCAMYWFHPLVWMAWRRLCLEAERASDDAVIESAERAEYAEQLVSLARRLSNRRERLASASTLGMAKRSDLSIRVSALLDGAQRRGRVGLWAAASVMLVASFVVLSIASVRAIAQPEVQPRPQASIHSEARPTPRPNPQPNAEPDARPSETPGPQGVGQSETQPEIVAASEIESQEQGAPGKDKRNRRSKALDRDLYEAAENGDLSSIDELLNEGANVNCALNGDGSPLIGAARKGRIDAVRLLLERGADPNMPVRGDGNPLIMAAREGHVNVAALLLDRGANIDQIVPGDENALIQASGAGHLQVVKLLVTREANVNARAWAAGSFFDRSNGEWRTPLSMARKSGRKDVVEFLLAAGARE